MARIFISSTTEDLADYRAAVVPELAARHHETVTLEVLGASPRSPLERSFELIDGCDLFVVIVAWRYGFIPTEGNPEQRSFVELEYDRAVRRKLPILVFVISEDASWPPRFIDKGEPGQHRLEQFKKKLLGRHTVVFFTSPRDLAEKVVEAVKAVAGSPRPVPQTNPPGISPDVVPLPIGVDAFELAWRLVVDQKAEPTLLKHMDNDQLRAAAAKYLANSETQPPPAPSILDRLRAAQPGLAPNPLWLAWMRETRPHTPPPGAPPANAPSGAPPNLNIA